MENEVSGWKQSGIFFVALLRKLGVFPGNTHAKRTKMTKKCYPQKFRTKGQYGNIRHTENMRTAQKTYSFLSYRAPQSAGQRRTSCIYSHFFSARGNRVKIFPKIPRNFILSAVFLCPEKLLKIPVTEKTQIRKMRHTEQRHEEKGEKLCV